MPAAFLSAPNDALAIIATIGAGLITLHVLSGWPDLGPDLGLGSADLYGASMHGIEPQPAGCLPAHPGPCRLPDLI